MRRVPGCFVRVGALVASFGFGSLHAFSAEAELKAAKAVPENIAVAGPSLTGSYILGPGDSLFIELLDVPELSGIFSIGPDGTLYLPRLRALHVEGLSVDELRYFLTDQYKAYIKDPQVFLYPTAYRSVRVYVGGEIVRPGYYDISSGFERTEVLNSRSTSNSQPAGRNNADILTSEKDKSSGGFAESARWPTLFDALQHANGVTPYSDLADVKVIRTLPISKGGGKVQAKIDFMQLVLSGNEAVNIRLFDGDVVKVGRSDKVLRDQLISATRTNLSPEFIQVYVSGSVKDPGSIKIPQGSTLNQAIASAGGKKLLSGTVEFLRLSPDGSSDSRRFSYKSTASVGSYNNPVLMTGDIVRVNQSLVSASIDVLNSVTGPVVGIYSVYSLFKP